jgi:hypothetical protein
MTSSEPVTTKQRSVMDSPFLNSECFYLLYHSFEEKVAMKPLISGAELKF